MAKEPWFSDEELKHIDETARLRAAKEAVDAWKPRLEQIRKNPRYTGAMIAGRE